PPSSALFRLPFPLPTSPFVLFFCFFFLFSPFLLFFFSPALFFPFSFLLSLLLFFSSLFPSFFFSRLRTDNILNLLIDKQKKAPLSA
ncbi:hypothetical protein J4U68_18665, partial [Escherichia coli]